MHRIIFISLLALIISALAACGASRQSGYQGYLYFAKGSYLMLFSLRDGSQSVVTHLGSKTINDISDFGENRLLIAESALVNRKEVHRISWVDVKSGQASALFAGVFARYLAASGLMIYDDGRRLFVVDFSGDSSSETIFTRRMNQITTVKVIPGDTLLIETSEQGLHNLKSYHVPTGTSRSLERLSGVCRLEHAVWIDDLEQLACKQQTPDETEGAYLLANLDGDVSRNLVFPEGKRFDAVTYVSAQGALVLSENWNSMFGTEERSAVWVHNIHSGENSRLAKKLKLGSSVVYTDF